MYSYKPSDDNLQKRIFLHIAKELNADQFYGGLNEPDCGVTISNIHNTFGSIKYNQWWSV